MEKELFPVQISPDFSAWLQQLRTELGTRIFKADEAITGLPQVNEASRGYPALPYAPEELEGLADEDSFTVELTRLINQHWQGTKRELCERALLLENTFYKIQSGKRAPGRDTLICLALALKLSREEANHLLGYFGYALGEAYKRDYIILRSLDRGRLPQEVNLLLAEYRLKLLGEEL
ncbi:MAG TPA: hypothetical protein VIM29_00120 [Bacillota bacterium]